MSSSEDSVKKQPKISPDPRFKKPLESAAYVRKNGSMLVTMYAKNVQENIDPNLLKRLKEVFENG